MKEFESRIDLNFPLEELSKVVCNEYNLGEFKLNKLINYENNFITASLASILTDVLDKAPVIRKH